jgi:hypothetical protein
MELDAEVEHTFLPPTRSISTTELGVDDLRGVIAALDLSPQWVYCLHFPPGGICSNQLVAQEIIEFARHCDKTAVFCDLAATHPPRGFGRWFHPRTCAGWLSRTAGVSQEEANELIRGFGKPIPRLLAACAATPRCFLGIAAAIAKRPDVLVYSTSGLDPSGRAAIHEYVGSRGRDLCVIYLSWAAVSGDGAPARRDCPQDAVCVTVDRKPEASTGGV